MIRTVNFLETDTQDDFLASFWLNENGSRHVTVIRSTEDDDDVPHLFTHEEAQPEFDRLLAAEVDGTRVWLKSERREYTLECKRAENPDMSHVRDALRRMNWDGSMELMLRRGPRKSGPRKKV